MTKLCWLNALFARLAISSVFLAALMLSDSSTRVRGQVPAPPDLGTAPRSGPETPTGDSASATPTNDADPLGQLLTRLVLELMPHTYTDTKHWGQQTPRWDGIEIRREGWKFHTRRRQKLVNHGRWRMFSAKLSDPEEHFSVALSNLRGTPDQEMAFDVDFGTRLKLYARQSQWVQGVQLYSISAEGRATLRLQVGCELGLDLDFGHFPPDLVLSPRVTRASIAIDEFRIDHVSKVGGEIAQQVTRLTQKVLEKKIDEKEKNIVDKINRQIKKNQQRLRWSVAQAIASPWTNEVKDALPMHVRKVLKQKGLPTSPVESTGRH